ncbi:glycosyltransferase family 4 protein [Sphingomonas gilva]|uniref:Glycosyltransferase family 4 protein n=1 Tax=Sphingomonas gilva TaxID=2305907 RepID=A0A396S0E2_9SPHN|nr:glycosyltransferase [Sphingomonas gilva]RHW16805.1 glycosyltransferase family 4 protein [Sphingomonas gilva]
MLRVLTLSTLFPDAARPNFGLFVERQTLGLAAHPDVEVKVVAPRGLPPFPLDRHPHYAGLRGRPLREDWNGLDVHRPRFLAPPMTQGRFHARALARALIPVLDAIRRDFAFDVIDAEFFFPDGPAAVALGRRYGVPVSIKARGADIHHWGRAPATAAQVLAAGREAGGLLAVAGALKADMAALGMPADRIRVHHTGVDLTAFRPAADRAAAKAALGVAGPLVVSVGALIPRKGHDLTIRAVASLPDACLRIAGEGPERGRLEALARELGVADRVALLGSAPHADLPPLLAAADVLALPSTSEGLANAWVEALASGTPVVTSDVGGARECIDRPAAGRIVARDPAAIAAAIADLLADPPDPQATRAAAERFTWEANTAALAEHLVSLTRINM